ncbi:MAG: hypothetical protein E6Q97_29320 [Desulfurellales bacterium]|nr:MAG: hypothetical protein E6Q97_29320 [Desulfurellales bacterium]
MPVPSAITDLSTTAASNYPQGGEAVGPLLDDYLRSIQAIMRSESQNKSWEQWGDTPTYVNATQFTVPGNLTSRYVVNRAIRATVSGVNYYGVITASAFSAVTTVTVSMLSGSLAAGLTAVALGGEVAETGAAIANAAMQSITASVASNALTVGLNPQTLAFRNATLTSGAPVLRSIPSALSLTVPSGATLGTTSGQQSRLVLLAIDNAGTLELGIVREGGGLLLDETNLISTVAISASSNTAGSVYSQTARSNVAYRVAGFVDITEATAGTWATAPTLVQGAGGQAIASQASYGFGQAWVDVTASRTSGTTYYNTTGKPITAIVTPNSGGSPSAVQVNGTTIFSSLNTNVPIPIVVPPNGSYNITVGGGVFRWVELR